MAREFSRSDRVASQLQRELAELLRTEVTNKALGMVTVSDVEVTRDLAVAKAYVSFLGASETPKRCVKLLMEMAPALRRELGRRIRLRVMPELRFVYDESIERGTRMDALLNQIAAEEPEADTDDEFDPSEP